MANEYINVYKGNPTAEAKDGTAVSTDGTFTAPIEFTLNVANPAPQTVALAVRTEEGYITAGNTTISDLNDINDRLKLCWTPDGTFADSISTAEAITAVNKLFYARASASSSERPQTDISAKFSLDCTIAAVT